MAKPRGRSSLAAEVFEICEFSPLSLNKKLSSSSDCPKFPQFPVRVFSNGFSNRARLTFIDVRRALRHHQDSCLSRSAASTAVKVHLWRNA